MENAVEALKTAAAVLIFVIAITISFTMFSKAKTSADDILLSQDTQEYLDAAELEDKLYVSSAAIQSGTSSITQENNATMTTKGYRIVEKEDVISTLYRYNLEKYGVTISDKEGNIIARYDSNTENLVRQYYNLSEEIKKKYIENLKNNTKNSEIEPNYYYINENDNSLYNLYNLTVAGNTKIACGAPWYGNDTEINKRINADVGGYAYIINNQTREISKGLNEILDESYKIIEIVNEIDNSKYLKDGDTNTSLLQQYELPTIEVVYIIY